MIIKYKKHLKITARKLRNFSTEEEIILWSQIRKNQILDIRFYRQKPIAGYILDFYAPKIKLAIKIDGPQHSKQENIDYDKVREMHISEYGILTKRYTNQQIRNNLNFILEDIYYYAASYQH